MFTDNPRTSGNIVLGLKRGVVKDLKDPDKLNRIKVTLIDEELDLPFADIMVKSANKDFGDVYIPQIGEEVIIGFLDGKINDPIILGSVFNSKTQPVFKINSSTNNIIFFSFPMGLTIQMDSKNNSESLTIKTKKGHIISLEDGSRESVEIKEKSGQTSFKVDFKSGEIELKARKKVSLSAGQDSLTVEANKGVSVSSSGGKFETSVNQVMLKANSNIKCTANAQFVAEGKASADIKSTGQASIKGSITKVG